MALPPDSMPVARWEFMALALMVIGSHGSDAEEYAQRQLDDAKQRMDSGAGVTWREVVKILPEARLQQAQRGGGQ